MFTFPTVDHFIYILLSVDLLTALECVQGRQLRSNYYRINLSLVLIDLCLNFINRLDNFSILLIYSGLRILCQYNIRR